jgi:hypothetical protein
MHRKSPDHAPDNQHERLGIMPSFAVPSIPSRHCFWSIPRREEPNSCRTTLWQNPARQIPKPRAWGLAVSSVEIRLLVDESFLHHNLSIHPNMMLYASHPRIPSHQITTSRTDPSPSPHASISFPFKQGQRRDLLESTRAWHLPYHHSYLPIPLT